jgi:hypothetical protein
LEKLASELLPEFFALLGIDFFLMLSLLICLLDERFPKAVPYVYQVAALAGFGHLLVSRNFLFVFGEYMRFWYCFLYLIVALANIVAVNIYLAVLKGLWNLAKVWSGAVTFPAILISVFFVSQYSSMQGAVSHLALQIGLVVSIFVAGMGICILLRPEIVRKLFRREKEVR